MKSPILSGPAMLLKSFGIDPALVQGKIEAAEKILNEYSRVMQERLSDIDGRLARIETQMLKLTELVTQSHGEVLPAGVSPEFYTQEKEPYGH